ncbi:uncharacterized protein HD556DRAFT_1003435 [Suillus plorans]|uniref:Uncharacterized protein n=1 Tax=Suillus plorans TaxID=116603 RepID=A0A9P7AEV8_9AGAM|nr:uncharacterized protein HD556DRAFT_1003435 [Suillus plorans]KAG1786894.1 hypothetical protein HD556DRAFT_1003435 [Suillus plorans]
MCSMKKRMHTDIRRSLDLDPQPVQQDEQNRDASIEFIPTGEPFRRLRRLWRRSRYSDNCPPSHLTSSTYVDERVLMEDVYTHVKRNNLCHFLTFVSQTQTVSLDDEDAGLSTEAITRLKFPLPPSSSTFHIQLRTSMHKIIIELHGWAPAFNAMSRNAVDVVFRNG